MGCIYLRTSPSGGHYVGKTVMRESKRWEEHVKEAHDIHDSNYDSILNRAIRKYGDYNFSVEILEDNLQEEELDEREKYWIKQLKTYYLDGYHGYNMTYGGDGRQKYDSKEILNLWSQGMSATDIAKLKDIDNRTITRYLESEGITSEEIWRQARTITGKKKSLKVKQFTLEGKYLKTWGSISEAYRETNISTTSISAACKHEGNRCSAGGYLWIYENDSIDIQILVNKAKNNVQISKKVICVETGQIFNTITDAANFFGKDRHTIKHACENGNLVKVIKKHFQYYKGE